MQELLFRFDRIKDIIKASDGRLPQVVPDVGSP